MSNPISPNGDVSFLHPLVRDKVKSIQAKLKAKKIPFEVFEASRTPERQAHLYAKGRTTNGPKVTWVQPWSSIHQYGLAVDFVLKINGKWSWDDQGAEAAYWDQMHEIAKEHGMTPLYDKKGRLIEKPHIQLVGVSAADLRKGIYPEGGDADWADHLAGMIDAWNGAQPASPKPDIAPKIPGIDAAIMEELEAEAQTPSNEMVFNSAGNVSPEADRKFQKLHGFIKRAEGGFSSHPDDKDGGATNFGITRDTLAKWRKRDVSVEEVRNLTQDEADAILRANYYTRCRCGEMPDRTAMVVYNTAVMSGPDRAIRMFQHAFNKTGLTVQGDPLVVDGIIGSKTMACAQQTDARLLSDKFLDLFEAYLRKRSNFDTFGNGWMNRIAKLREFLTTLPTGAGKRPKRTMKISDRLPDIDKDDLLRAALAGVTGGKSAVIGALLGNVLKDNDEDSANSARNKALAKLMLEDKIDLGDLDDKPVLASPPAPVPIALPPDNNPPLTPVNRALGEGIGRLLNGKKSVIGILGLIAAAVIPELGLTSQAAPQLSELLDGDNQTLIFTLLSIFTSWGFLGKIDKAIRTVRAYT